MSQLDAGGVTPLPDWAGLDSPLAHYIREKREQRLLAYRASPDDIVEHANIEAFTKQGGYERRQIYELVQNGADALLEHAGGRIEVVLTSTALYCANQGDPVDEAGVAAILASHSSNKRGNEIGRFGLGFKSVLGVTSRPEFYSRSGSFRFNPYESERSIRHILPAAAAVPMLRLAEPLDANERRCEDAVLDHLMEWAATVVKLPLDRGHTWLAEDLRTFPAEFLLFSPHVGQLIMVDRSEVDGSWSPSQSDLWRRQISLSRRPEDGNGYESVILDEGDQRESWKVFRTIHRPSAQAKEEGGVSTRDEIPLMWAVPERRRSERSRFWAFFPTEQETTLSGILNAPWKTNEDRWHLLPSRFNEELLQAAAKMLVANLVHLVPADDPGYYLEILPSLNDPPCWADRQLSIKSAVEPGWVYQLLLHSECLLDADGVLRRPESLNWHPKLSREALEIWHSCPGRPSDWIHPSFESQHRRARLEYIMRLAACQPKSFAAWLTVLVKDRSIVSSAYALRAAAAAVKQDAKLLGELATARIVKTNFDSLVPPRAGTVFLPRNGDAAEETKASVLTLVHPDLLAYDGVAEALEVLGIKEIEATSQLEAILDRLAQTADASLKTFGWGAFWNSVHGIPTEEAVTILRERLGVPNYTRLWIRTLAGTFAPLGRALLPGRIADGAEAADLGAIADMDFHSCDQTLLELFGATDTPQPGCKGGMDVWSGAYHDHVQAQYLKKLTTGSVPRAGYLEFATDTTTGPLDVYAVLKHPKHIAAFTHALLEHALTEEPWEMRHKTNRDRYPALPFEPPSLWAVRQHGSLQTSRGIWRLSGCFAPHMDSWRSVLPVADVSTPIAEMLRLTTSLHDLDRRSLLALEPDVHRLCRDSRLLSEFYACLVAKGVTLDYILCRVGDQWEMRKPTEVYCEVDADRVRRLINGRSGHLHATVEERALLVDEWGLQIPSFKMEVMAVPSDEPTPLLDAFPQLWEVDEPKAAQVLATLQLIPCSELSEHTLTAGGRIVTPEPFIRAESNLYHLDSLSRGALFEQILRSLDLDLPSENTQSLQSSAHSIKASERLLRIRTAEELPDKLLLAVGGKALRSSLQHGLLSAEKQLRGDPSPRRIAELALAVYGVEVLQHFHADLADRGLNPPKQWAGRHQARRFVAALGFSPEYAGFESARRAPTEEVEGPVCLPDEHDYQRGMMDAIRRLPDRIEAGKSATRGLLSLPTGAGKTRVAVQALVEAVRDGEINAKGKRCGPILWIAQSDELCEQAVVSWRTIWRSRGPQRRLTISRLWRQNEADPASDETVQVVVATIDKIKGCVGDANYSWLSQPAFVVVDEAHGAVGKEYTALFEWLGLSWRDQAAARDRCPLLGLTATAFRGNEEETTRLVSRFGSYRLDFEVWNQLGFEGSNNNPYPYLQKLGVLANVKHRVLTGIDIELDESEMAELVGLRRLPRAAEERLGAKILRNRIILNEVKALPEDWQVLLFATSVTHAQTMAALLCLEGIQAAAISGETSAAARRHVVEEFRRGKIRVLTNYNVLTTGFDAPSVRCVIVARPVYSPGLYQQMIGRGLRGMKNGGTDFCDIINVRDTVLNFGEEPAFTQFEYLWNSELAARRAEAYEEVIKQREKPAPTPQPKENLAPINEPDDVGSPRGGLPDDRKVEPRSIRTVREYRGELGRRWRHLDTPLEGTLQTCLQELERQESEAELSSGALRDWEETSIKALQNHARMLGIKDSQMPMPRR